MQTPTESKHTHPKIIKLTPRMMTPLKTIIVPAFLYSYWIYTIKHLVCKILNSNMSCLLMTDLRTASKALLEE